MISSTPKPSREPSTHLSGLNSSFRLSKAPRRSQRQVPRRWRCVDPPWIAIDFGWVCHPFCLRFFIISHGSLLESVILFAMFIWAKYEISIVLLQEPLSADPEKLSPALVRLEISDVILQQLAPIMEARNSRTLMYWAKGQACRYDVWTHVLYNRYDVY